ncbi:MAG TPA: hypothetical protein PLB38_02380 [bacterium]|nr:hypothetical protein [bacterium]
MSVEYKISKTLNGYANRAAERLFQRPDSFNEILPDPFDNFMVWRESVLDLKNVDSEKVILRITHEDQVFVLIWNKPEEPHHG